MRHTENKTQTPFHTGERVALAGNSGVIIAAFPDGFHLVQLDESHEVTGAHFSQLLSIDDRHAGFDRDVREHEARIRDE